MIRRTGGQLSFGDAALFGARIPDLRALMGPELAKLDELLDDDRLVDVVLSAQRARWEKSATMGRESTPAEVVLRMLVLRKLRKWSFEATEREIKGSLVYRRFCRIDAGTVPDSKTVLRQSQLLGGEQLEAMLEVVVVKAKELGATKGRKMRIDTTVVETPIRYPSDSRLCEDVTEVLCREMERVREAGLRVPVPFRRVHRSVQRRVREITSISRRRIGKDKKREALKRPYLRLLGTTRRVLRQVGEVLAAARRRRRPVDGRIQRSLERMTRVVALGEQVVTQTRRRLLQGITNSKEKIVSIFEPHTRILRRGKPHKPTEFGEMVYVQEVEGGFVTGIGVTTEHDSALLVPAVERHKKTFGKVPRVVAGDRGFYSASNVEALENSGVRVVALRKTGHRSEERRAFERRRAFRKAAAWRAGGEARISHLKHDFGMLRTA